MTTFEPVALDDFLLKFFPREYVSASSLKMYVRCPEQWRRRYVLNQKAPPNSNMLWGGADHRAVGANYEQKIESEKDLPVKEVQERFAAELDEGIAQADDEIEWAGKDLDGKTPAQARDFILDRGANLVGMYQEQVAPVTFPLTVEKEFLLPVDGLGVPVKGYVDLTAERRVSVPFQAETHSHEGSFVVERKTKGSNQPPAPDDRFQARVYELATGLPVEFQVSVKTAQPRVTIHEPLPLSSVKSTTESLRRMVLGIAHCYTVYGEEQPWPDHGRLHTFACSFCGFRETCPWWEPQWWPK